MILLRKTNRKTAMELLFFRLCFIGAYRYHPQIKECQMISHYILTWVVGEFTYVCVSSKFRFLLPLWREDKGFGLFYFVR